MAPLSRDPRLRVAAGIAKGLVVAAMQALLTSASLFLLAFVIILASHAPYEDMLSVVGWVFWSAVAALLTTAIVMLIGLPLRLIPVLRRWWEGNGEFALAGGIVGLLLVLAAFLTGVSSVVMLSGQEFEVFTPNGWLLISGWLLSGFCCAHLLWPRRWGRLVSDGVSAARSTRTPPN